MQPGLHRRLLQTGGEPRRERDKMRGGGGRGRGGGGGARRGRVEASPARSTGRRKQNISWCKPICFKLHVPTTTQSRPPPHPLYRLRGPSRHAWPPHALHGPSSRLRMQRRLAGHACRLRARTRLAHITASPARLRHPINQPTGLPASLHLCACLVELALPRGLAAASTPAVSQTGRRDSLVRTTCAVSYVC